MSINLLKLTLYKARSLEEAQEGSAAVFFKKSANTIAKWLSSTTPPDIGAAQTALDDYLASAEGQNLTLPKLDSEQTPPQGVTIPPKEDHEPQIHKTTMGDGIESEKYTQPGELEKPAEAPRKRISILMPTSSEKGVMAVTTLALLGSWKATLPAEHQALLANLDIQTDTNAHSARNMLATRFLKTQNEWSFWMDRDMIVSFGNPAWFADKTGKAYDQQFAGQAYINRLMSHNKTIVGCAYSERSRHGRMLFAGGMKEKGAPDTELMAEIRSGPKDKLVMVDWIGFGAIAVHRKVLEDMIERCPEVKPASGTTDFRFFNPLPEATSHGGEDVAFCTRAKRAGHATYMDLSCIAGHVGMQSYMP